jgi:hypothetical protein
MLIKLHIYKYTNNSKDAVPSSMKTESPKSVALSAAPSSLLESKKFSGF